MNMKIILFLVLLFAFSVFAQDRIMGVADTIALADTVIIIDGLDGEGVNLFQAFFEDSVKRDEDRRVFAYISLSPRVGRDRIMSDFADFLSKRMDTIREIIQRENIDVGMAVGRPQIVRFQAANATGVSFNLETGLMVKATQRTTLGLGVGYSFGQMRAIYGLENPVDTTPDAQILRSTTHLVNNTLSFSLSARRVFDTSYFRIDGIENAGVFAGASLLLSRYFERDTINSPLQELAEFVSFRRRNHDGLGASGRIGLFARQRMGERSFFEYSIGYIMRVVSGFEEVWDRDFLWDDTRANARRRILSVSNGLELSFTLIF